MAEIVGRIDPQVLEHRMRHDSIQKEKKRKLAKAYHDHKEAEKRVLSGKFNSIKVRT
jgi:hypothetical protein